MKILLHCCCAPCSVACIKRLIEEGHEVALYFFNPNIAPQDEYQRRKQTLVDYAEQIGLSLAVEERSYEDYLSVRGGYQNRCEGCYDIRMDAAAREAAGRGFDAFTTTLLISPYQDHQLLADTARQAAQRQGAEFLYMDFRPHFREGQASARQMGMYRQKYCGCLNSKPQ